MKKFKISGTDIVLIVVALYIVIFNYQMIEIFKVHEAVPDVLITVLYGVTFGELGFCTYIYKKKHDKNKEDPTDGIHRTDVLPEDKADGDQGYAGEQDLGILDSSSGIHRVKQRKFWSHKRL